MPMQKCLPKKQVAKIKPGTVIELCWKDAPNSLALLLGRMDPGKGEISLHVLHQDTLAPDCHATNEQVVRVIGPMTWPTI